MERTVYSVVLALAIIGCLGAGVGCGKVDGAKGGTTGMSTCQDLAGTYHFDVFVPPWKYVKEYRCDDGDFRNCNLWTATGRYVFVVSDAPFVSFDSEIITSLTVEALDGNALSLLNARISEIAADADAELVPASPDRDYRELETVSGYPVFDIAWRQQRTFESKNYYWHRRDSYIQTSAGRTYHLEFFSLYTLWQPEFDVLVTSFDLGPAPDDAPHCRCVDERVSPPEPCQ
jgi:hypothetical protein